MITTSSMTYADALGVKIVLHIGINLLGVHLFILTQGTHVSIDELIQYHCEYENQLHCMESLKLKT